MISPFLFCCNITIGVVNKAAEVEKIKAAAHYKIISPQL
jgi:hypothetical protein